MPYKLFVGGLPWATTADELEQLFSRYGDVTSAKVISDRKTGRSKGYGFVEMDDREAAEGALSALNNSELGGRQITVEAGRETPPS